ncbi:MAG: hypothetical protein ABL927_08185 [Bdellovibrionales bacterium]
MKHRLQILAGIIVLMCALSGQTENLKTLQNPINMNNSLVSIITTPDGENLLADAIGKTLYVFDLDKGEFFSSACRAECAETWPPLLVSVAESKTLLAPFGIISRPTSDKMQLTYNGQPLYTYAFDRVSGEDSGDGIGGVWHYIEIKNK